MKRSLLTLLAMAFCLSACAPADSAPQSEVPARATAETAGTVEENETTISPVEGALRNMKDCENTGKALYRWQVEAQPDGSPELGKLVEVGYATAQQRVVQDTGIPTYRLRSCYARGNTAYYVESAKDSLTLHIVDLTDGTEKTMPVVEDYSTGFLDDRYLYLFVASPTGYSTMQRVDPETGTDEMIPLPGQALEICDGADGRFLITRLIGQVSLSGLEDAEQRSAALQTAAVEYAWWDPVDGSVEPLFQEPYTGELSESGWPQERVYLGRADGKFYFYRAEQAETGRINCRVERCAPDGSGTETVLALEDGQGQPFVYKAGGEIQWLVRGIGSTAIEVYQTADSSTRRVETPSGNNVALPRALTDDGRVLMFGPDSNGPEKPTYRLVRQEDYLAGNFTGTDVGPLGEE